MSVKLPMLLASRPCSRLKGPTVCDGAYLMSLESVGTKRGISLRSVEPTTHVGPTALEGPCLMTDLPPCHQVTYCTSGAFLTAPTSTSLSVGPTTHVEPTTLEGPGCGLAYLLVTKVTDCLQHT